MSDVIEIPTKGEHFKNMILKEMLPALVHENKEVQELWTQLVTDFMDRQVFTNPRVQLKLTLKGDYAAEDVATIGKELNDIMPIYNKGLLDNWQMSVAVVVKLYKEIAECRVLHHG